MSSSRTKTEVTEISPGLGASCDAPGAFDVALAFPVTPFVVDPLLQHLPMGWMSFGHDHRIQAVNPKLAQMYPPVRDAVGIPLVDAWPDMADTLDPLIDSVFDTAHPLSNVAARSHALDGALNHYRISLYPVHQPDGSVASVAALIDDITRTQHAEEALLHSEAQFRSMFELSGLGKAQCDARTGRILRVNSRFCQMLGYTAAEMIGRSFIDITHPDDRRRDQEAFERLVKGELTEIQSEKRYLRKDGSTLWVSINERFIHDDQGNNLCTIASIQDISQRRQREKILRRTTEHNERNLAQLRGIVQAMTEGLIICNPRRHLTFNPAAMAMFGFDENVSTSAPMSMLDRAVELRDLDDRPLTAEECPHVRALAGQTFGNYEVKVYRKARGDVRIFSYSGAPVRNAVGTVILGLNTVRDITERKAAEDELRLAKQQAEEASRAKDRFLATLSHELRTPLTPVLMVAHSLEQDSTLPDTMRRDIEMIRRNVEMEARLIDDLLDLTRIVRQKLELHREAVNLHVIVDQAVSICRQSIGGDDACRCSVDLDAQSHMVWADSSRMQQVFWNLLNNALKFTESSGCVTIRSHNPSPDRIRVEVTDSGIGIQPEQLDSIFNAFEQGGTAVTRRSGGLGLGLAISKALVDLHGGTITAQSQGPGTGATFAVEMPVVAEPPPAPPPAQTARNVPDNELHNVRVLLVEDHATTARVLRRLLEAEKFSIQTADCVQDALQLAETHTFELVVSDVGLPDGTGHDLMRALRARMPNLRGIAVSGFGMEEDLKRSRAAGFSRHLVKPVSFGMLRDTIREVMA